MKYELTTTYKIVNGVVVYQIKSLIFIPSYSIAPNDLGGYVEGEHNLSQDGDCWIDVDATVYGNIKVIDDAYVGSNTILYRDITLNGRMYLDGNFNIKYSKISNIDYIQDGNDGNAPTTPNSPGTLIDFVTLPDSLTSYVQNDGLDDGLNPEIILPFATNIDFTGDSSRTLYDDVWSQDSLHGIACEFECVNLDGLGISSPNSTAQLLRFGVRNDNGPVVGSNGVVGSDEYLQTYSLGFTSFPISGTDGYSDQSVETPTYTEAPNGINRSVRIKYIGGIPDLDENDVLQSFNVFERVLVQYSTGETYDSGWLMMLQNAGAFPDTLSSRTFYLYHIDRTSLNGIPFSSSEAIGISTECNIIDLKIWHTVSRESAEAYISDGFY